ETVPTLDDSVDESIARNLIPRHTYISDCIIVRAPLTDKNRTTYDGLSVVVMWVIQLAHYFLRAGYLVHGGIAVGKVSHTSVNVIGPAYQEAYQLEQRCNDPIVVLSCSAAKHWHGGSRMCLEHQGRVFA